MFAPAAAPAAAPVSDTTGLVVTAAAATGTGLLFSSQAEQFAQKQQIIQADLIRLCNKYIEQLKNLTTEKQADQINEWLGNGTLVKNPCQGAVVLRYTPPPSDDNPTPVAVDYGVVLTDELSKLYTSQKPVSTSRSGGRTLPPFIQAQRSLGKLRGLPY